MKTKDNKKMSRRTMKLVRRALALVMSFAIVISMGVVYSPDWFLKANDEGGKVSEPVVSEQEVVVETAEETAEPAEEVREEVVEEVVIESEPAEEVQEEPEAAEETSPAGDEAFEDAGIEEAAEEIADSEESGKMKAQKIEEDAEEEAEEEEEKENASIVFSAGGAQVTSVNVEKYRGNDLSLYWKDVTATVTGAEDQKYKISWSSTDKTISKPLTDKVDTKYCNDIKIVGYKLGTVTFTATANVNGETVSAYLTVNVCESSSWTTGETEMSWDVSPEGELRISAVNGDGVIDFDGGDVPWSTYKTSITSIVIDDSVTTIGENAFKGCTALEQVTIGSGVTTISAGTFEDCRNLRDVTFADKESIVTIGPGAFRHCDSLTELDLSGCVNLVSIDGDPESWTRGAFSYGGKNKVAERSLIKVDLTGCTSLEEIGDGAFYDRRYIDLDMSTLTGLVRIGTGALEDKHEFNRIDFSVFTELEEIGAFAFRNNTGVVVIDMSEGTEYALTTIRADAFTITSNFKSNLVMVDFSGCPNLSTIEAGAFQWSGGRDGKTLETVNLSGTALTALEANTFLNQNTLTNISIPANMERIDDSAFRGCSGIRNIKWEATDYTRSVANTFSAVSKDNRAAMKITIGKDVNILPEDFFTSLSGASIEFEPGNDGIMLKLAGDTEYRTYIVDENGRLYLKAEDAGHEYTEDEELSAGKSWLDLGDREILTYNGDEQVLVIPVIPEEGTLSYRFSTDGSNEWKELSEETASVITAVDSGVYEIYFRLTTIANRALKEKKASTKVEIAKAVNPVKITINGLSMTPNSPAYDFSKDLVLSDDYEGSMSDFVISYQVNGSTTGRVNTKETYNTTTTARSGGSITAQGVYTPAAAGGVDVVTIVIDGRGEKAGNIEQAIYKVPVKVEADVHTITFIDGLGNVIDEVIARAGKPVSAPADPEAEGLWFSGWNQEIPTNMPNEDMTIEAEWKPVGQLLLTPKSAEYYYDGTEKSVEGFVSMEADYYEESFTVSGITAEASGIEIGVYDVEVNGTPEITDEDGRDVTDRFTVEYDDASLRISEAPKPEDDTVIINYVDEDGEPVAEPVEAGSHTGPIVSPQVEDMEPEFTAVEINGASDTSVSVVYRSGRGAGSEDRYVLGRVDENGELTEILSSGTPLTADSGETEEPARNWAFLNLLFMIASMIVAAYMVLKGRKAWTVSAIAGIVIAIISAALFFMTEDLTGAIVMADKYTIVMADALLAELIALLYSKKIGSEE